MSAIPPGEESPDAGTRGQPDTSALFGRGLLYVVVASLQIVTGALVSPILAHTLADPAQFGRLSSAIALHQLLVVFAVVGLDQAIELRRAQQGHDRDARALVFSAVVLAAVVTGILWLTQRWWATALGFAPSSQLVAATIVWTLPAAAVMVLLAQLLSSDRLRDYSWVSLVAAVGGQVVGVALVFAVEPSARTYAWGLVAADTVAAAIGWYLVRPSWRRSLSWPLLGPTLAFSLPLMLGSLSTFVLNAGDRIILQRLLGPAEVGRYQVAYTVGFVAVQLIVLTSSSWTPRFAAVKDELARWRLINRSRDLLYTVLAPVLIGLVLGAPVLLRVVAPASFQPGALLPVVFLVVVSAYPVAALGATGRFLVTQGRSRPLALCTALAAVVNVGLNLVLVPVLGIAGAAVATVFAYSSQALGQRIAVGQPDLRPRTPTRVLVLSAVAVLAAGATIWLPQSEPWNVAKFVLGLACLPWFWRRLQRARHEG